MKKIVDTKDKLLQNSITNYKILKKRYINDVFTNDIDKETKLIEKRENELMFLKRCHEKKLKEKNLKSSELLNPIRLEKIYVRQSSENKNSI